MINIKSAISEKLSNLNDNGKILFLFKIIQYCFEKSPDLTKISFNVINEQIDQLISMINFVLQVNNKSTINRKTDIISEIQKIQQQNQILNKEIHSRKKELQIQKFNKRDLDELKRILSHIYRFKKELNISAYNLEPIKNKFQHFSFLSMHVPDLEPIYKKCKEDIDNFETQLKSIISKNEEIESQLRSKINEL